MKSLLLILVASAAALIPTPAKAQAKVLVVYCDALSYGVGACSDYAVSTGFLTPAYAQDNAIAQCSNGSFPSASAYAFTSCGPATAVAQCGASGDRLFCSSYIVGLPQAGDGYYSQDCSGTPYGDGNSDGDCTDINDLVQALLQLIGLGVGLNFP